MKEREKVTCKRCAQSLLQCLSQLPPLTCLIEKGQAMQNLLKSFTYAGSVVC